jgi:hypothetical protein
MPLPESVDAVQVNVGVESVVEELVVGVPGLVGAVVSDEDEDVLVAVFGAAAVNDRLGVSVIVLVAVPTGVLVRVAVLVGSTNRVPVTVAVGDGVREDTPWVVSGVLVHRFGKERGDGVMVGTFNAATWVGGGNGLIKVYGLTKIFIKIVARAKPPSITIEANMSQNDSFIAFHPSVIHNTA